MNWHLITSIICIAFLICIDGGAVIAVQDYAPFYASPIENDSPPTRIPPYA